jgi:hypothetical protein
MTTSTESASASRASAALTRPTRSFDAARIPRRIIVVERQGWKLHQWEFDLWDARFHPWSPSVAIRPQLRRDVHQLRRLTSALLR